MSVEPDKKPNSWAEKCQVKTTNLVWKDYVDELTPILELVSDHMNIDMNITLQNPWINHYELGSYQEIHDHTECDMSAVMFLNDGDNFSKFYFYDRLSFQIGDTLRTLLNLDDFWYPDINVGDVIAFPSTFCHGVTPHRSEVTRKTFSFNFKVNQYE